MAKEMVDFSSFPHWLQALLQEKFFNSCLVHEAAKKNEKNIFCLDCCTSICPHCSSPHRLLQIRRYVYHDVIRLDDIERLIDCSFVQAYTTNNAKVVFLNQRPQSRTFKGSGNICSTCDRSLQYPYLFCSLSCKVRHLLRNEGGLLKYLCECDFLPLPEGVKGESFCEFEDGQMSPDSILDSPIWSGSSASGGGVGCKAFSCTANTTEFAKKKKRSSVSVSRIPYTQTCSPVCEMAISMMNRRKGIPHRSPLY